MQDALSRTADAIEKVAEHAPRGLRERILHRWFGCIRAGRLSVEFPSGGRAVFDSGEAGPNAIIKITSYRLLARILISGELGFAESYMAGEWETPDLTALFRLSILNEDVMSDVLRLSGLIRGLNRFRHRRHANTRRGSRRNIAAHYDLGNEFYQLWLDRGMTYSSALFEAPGESLADAQQHKYLRLAEKLSLRPGDEVLEIGCGWGGFAEIAAGEFGGKVTALTLSREQAAFAKARIARAGLTDRVEVRLQDYRDVEGQFDKIVSIEMFEAVGEAYWQTYLETLQRRLKPGGRAGLQVITINDDFFETYRDNPDFIQRYIFPGGMLPSPKVMARQITAAGLQLTDSMFFGRSYAETLRRWDDAFVTTWPEVEALGFDSRFFRMWRYYLTYCEAGFDNDRIDVGQFIIGHG
jgi:cyclopropane-fatty-acyl-phospholipid synthase